LDYYSRTIHPSPIDRFYVSLKIGRIHCHNRKELASKMYKIDNIDLQIANLLVEDGRMSSAEVARRIGGISERSARYRIDRLIREGVISVNAIANPRAVGLTVVADVWLEVESDMIHSVADQMTQYECVTYVAYAIGETDVSVQVVGRDTNEIYRFVTDVIGRTHGVRKTTTSIVPLVLKDVNHWRFPASVAASEPEKDTQ
jgi:Lrp/AsnC family transcriptional regulator, regulator for asnA, asnC and gidA